MYKIITNYYAVTLNVMFYDSIFSLIRGTIIKKGFASET